MDETATDMKVAVAEEQTDVTGLAVGNAPNYRNMSSVPNAINSPNETYICCKIKISKALIPLKISLFCWFAGMASLFPFMVLYLKQLGLHVKELTIIHTILPFVQLLAPTVAGALRDKTGRSKPVLLANLFVGLLAANCMLLIPKPRMSPCNVTPRVRCHEQTANNMFLKELCSIRGNESSAITCIFYCSREPSFHISDSCFQDYVLSCHVLLKSGIFSNVSFPKLNFDDEIGSTCASTEHTDINLPWCARHFANNCSSSCEINKSTRKAEATCQPQLATSKVFILSLVLLLLHNSCHSCATAILDFTAVSMAETYNSDFGRLSIWSLAGGMVASAVSGYIISSFSQTGEPQRYDVAFYIFDVMTLITLVALWKLDVMIEPPGKGMLKKFVKLLKSVDILVFMLTICVIGTAWGFSRVFSNWYLEDLGASSTLMGLALSVGDLTGMPFLFISKWFLEKIGSSNILLSSLVAYALLFIGYSFLINPWWAIAYNILEIFTYHLLWVSIVTHSYFLAPPGLTATVIGIAGGIHFGVGKGSGSLIGGITMSKYGGRLAFRVMAAMCGCTAVLYALYAFFRTKQNRNDMDSKSAEN